MSEVEAPEDPFIATETMEQHLFSAALALSQRRPLLLEGPPGMTSLVVTLLYFLPWTMTTHTVIPI